MKHPRPFLPPRLLAAACLALIVCGAPVVARDDGAAAPESGAGLRALADFPVGVAVPAAPWPNDLLKSPERQALVEHHFSSLTAENIMKMSYLQPERGRFMFEHADALVDYARRHGMLMHGHALVWHRQAPEWMNRFEGSRQEFIEILEAHVQIVAGHFAGRLASWDVVNETFQDGDPTEYRRTIWLENIGPEYIELAFRAARRADPHADLYYNDYDISGAEGPGKLDRILRMLDDFKARDVPIDGIGFQMHIDTDEPDPQAMREAFLKAVGRGLKVRISELDVSVNQSGEYAALTPELAQRQRRRYAEVVRIYKGTVPDELRGGLTVWGITDGDSWIPGFRNRPDWPLLFDAEFRPKPALRGLAEGLRDCPE
ncbi:MAG: endo-1,4-beta-xylanase [Woeseiaceae bacterium]